MRVKSSLLLLLSHVKYVVNVTHLKFPHPLIWAQDFKGHEGTETYFFVCSLMKWINLPALKGKKAANGVVLRWFTEPPLQGQLRKFGESVCHIIGQGISGVYTRVFLLLYFHQGFVKSFSWLRNSGLPIVHGFRMGHRGDGKGGRSLWANEKLVVWWYNSSQFIVLKRYSVISLGRRSCISKNNAQVCAHGPNRLNRQRCRHLWSLSWDSFGLTCVWSCLY